ncbi:TAXI family TRAP transporter solute-binding subunit [Mesorhizobium sp. M2A.F.Ca.ET.039.01.1.1]|uniref:TAXI family TRAP transporter solute-binding subunit n=1 Tax=Mesorhizobium sp. M2A.F.Ca.ET.039.01.1.1 TaxID=2496746 RepID=UPI00167BE971|nr:TAXI family TRAP transporter solute-binding subunit [Mesorhizobium sp. M2A.F.Ca.ET.039.01.1.1]
MRTLSLLAASSLALFASHAFAAPTEIKLCTGIDGGPYAEAGKMIAGMAKGDPNISVRVVMDTGGTWGNIQRTVLGEGCDAMIGQPDGAAVLKRQNPGAAASLKPIADLHREYLHALCSKESGVDDIGDLESSPKANGYSIALGDTGSGAWLIWQNFVAQDSDYGEVPVKNESGVIALASVAANETTCVLQPAALGNSLVRQADEQFGDGLALVGVNDRDFDNATDPQGKPLYTYSKIPSGTYAKSLQGWFSGKSTVTWLAKVYVNSDRITDQKALAAFITAVARAKPAIQAQYGK